MFIEDDMIPIATGRMSPHAEMMVAQQQSYRNDDFDDVFGSAPPSPTREHDPDHDYNTLRDRRQGEDGNGNEEVSDIPRLKEKHQKEGYRDGVTRGKAQSVQKGFDEGYGLGAVLGLRIGRVRGVLEGVGRAVKAAASVEGIEGDIWDIEKARVEGLVKDARGELNTKSIFGTEYWGDDGIWKFLVPGEGDGKEVLFPDIAGAHPLVAKWEEIVEKEVQRWRLDLGIMDGVHGEVDLETPKKQDEVVVDSEERVPGAARKELNW